MPTLLIRKEYILRRRRGLAREKRAQKASRASLRLAFCHVVSGRLNMFSVSSVAKLVLHISALPVQALQRHVILAH